MSDTQRGSTTRGRGIAWVVGAFVLVAVLTIVVYLMRAGLGYTENWPTNFELTSSDNSVLFQVTHDLFTGVPLDWSFSPQVYVFPELPISLLAYLLVGGSFPWYFVAVAVLNNLLLFAVLWLLIHLIFAGSLPQQLFRSFVAFSPLLVLPMLGLVWHYAFHLAPTYYFGVYLFGLLLPAVLLVKRTSTKALIMAGWALAGAANPLLLALTLPSIALFLFVTFLKNGWRGSVAHQSLMVGIFVAVSALVRILVFNPLAGTSPADYLTPAKAVLHLEEIATLFGSGFTRWLDPFLLGISVAAFLGCIVMLGYTLRTFFGSNAPATNLPTLQVKVYLLSMPFLGALAMHIIMAINDYYLWFALVGSVVIALLYLPVPARVFKPTAITLAAVIALVSVAGIVGSPKAGSNYFGYQSEASTCLDRAVPGQTGYSTFSDARSFSLLTKSGVQLIPVNANLRPSYWLTNKAVVKITTGTFVMINPATPEQQLKADVITAAFGAPSSTVTCGPYEIWLYPTAAQKAQIASFFSK